MTSTCTCSSNYDLAIVGAGIMGSAVAWRARAAGLRTILLEKSPHPTNNLGSSHGHSRIVRRTYLESHYARLMNATYPLWEELSQTSGCGPLRPYPTSPVGSTLPPPLIRHTGGLSVVHKGSKEHTALLHSCASAGVGVREVGCEEAAARWGLTLPPTTLVVEEAGDTGVAVGVGRCVRAMQRAAMGGEEGGVDFKTGCEVVGLEQSGACGSSECGRGECVVLEVKRGAAEGEVEGGANEFVRAKRVVLCPGPWAGPLLTRLLGITLPLQPLLCSTAYYRLKTPQEAAAAAAAAGVAGVAGVAAAAVAGVAAAAVAGEEGKEPLPVLIDWRPLQSSDTSGGEEEGGGGIYGCPVTVWNGVEGKVEEEDQKEEEEEEEREGALYPGCYKFAIHAGVPTSADSRGFEPHAPTTVIPVSKWIARHAPHFHPHPVLPPTTCLYTMTPDEAFVLSEVCVVGRGRCGAAGGAAVFLAGGFSGHGFKFAPLVGELAAQWAVESLKGGREADSSHSSSSLTTPMDRVEAWLQKKCGPSGAGRGKEGEEDKYLPLFALSRFDLDKGKGGQPLD